MRHVLLETNWLVDVACPEPFRVPAATELLDRASRGEVVLYVPNVSLSEARKTIRSRYKGGRDVIALRRYLTASLSATASEAAKTEVEATRKWLQRYEQDIERDLRRVEIRLEEIRRSPGVVVFALDERMHLRSIELSLKSGIELDPFDNAVLAAVLVKAEDLRDLGEADVVFAEKDGDLQPWNRDGGRRTELAGLYDRARVWVVGSFTLDDRRKPEDW